MNINNITNFIFELGHLQKIKHEGWRLAGIPNPESVAEHSLRAAQIGFILAHMEGYKNPEKVATMAVFHDIGECRIGDIHKLADNYITKKEKKAVEDQTSELDELGNKIKKLWIETEKKSSPAGILAKDADLLEQAFWAKQYMETGYKEAENWIKNIKKLIISKSAKKLLNQLQKNSAFDWWKNLK